MTDEQKELDEAERKWIEFFFGPVDDSGPRQSYFIDPNLGNTPQPRKLLRGSKMWVRKSGQWVQADVYQRQDGKWMQI